MNHLATSIRRTSLSRLFLPAAFCLLPATVLQANTGASIKFNQSGLSSLTYGGKQFLNNGSFQIGNVLLQDSSGNITSGNLTPLSTTVNQANNQVALSFSWGSAVCAYSVEGNKVEIQITTTNLTNSTIVTLVYSPLTIQFPSKIKNFDGVDPIVDANLGGPTVLPMDYASGVVVLANEDPSKPLMSGFPWTYNAPTNTIFPLRINTGQDPMYPTFYPNIQRPIAPGASDTYKLSLRFGPSSATPETLAPDVYQNFAATFPSTLNWTDRRPIGMLVLATSATGWATNPRGWFLNPSIDVTTAAGIAAFHTQVIQWAKSSIAILKSMNAQGMITWDIEGEQFPQPTGSYVGDPRQIATFAPEMNSIADEYFSLFRSAGLKVGICIRPQNIVLAANMSGAMQNYVADPTQLLISKIQYAQQRWGATLFYVDSNVDPNGGVDDASIFQRVAAAVPGVLLMPEHSNLQYYAYTAPYLELDQGYTSSPTLARFVYSSAFSILNTANGPAQQDFTPLLNSVNAGDSLMFRGWFAAPENPVVSAIYQAAAPPN